MRLGRKKHSRKTMQAMEGMDGEWGSKSTPQALAATPQSPLWGDRNLTLKKSSHLRETALQPTPESSESTAPVFFHPPRLPHWRALEGQ